MQKTRFYSIFASVLFALCFLGLLSAAEIKKGGFASTLQGKIPSKAIKSFSPGGQYILLTFSGGPHFEITPQILDILKTYSAKATFFVSGQKALHHSDIMKRMIAEKHDLGHQGFYTNIQYDSKSKAEIGEHVTAVQSLLMNVTNQQVNYFRPPGRSLSNSLYDWVQNEKSTKTILWSIDMGEVLKSQDVTEKEIREKFQKYSEPGDIINCYDHKMIVKVLPAVLETLIAEKYEFLTISEMLSFPDDAPH
jgi:peptidoglycan/xylan/chitin deacetylase (PgdA/CDA1 family)